MTFTYLQYFMALILEFLATAHNDCNFNCQQNELAPLVLPSSSTKQLKPIVTFLALSVLLPFDLATRHGLDNE